MDILEIVIDGSASFRDLINLKMKVKQQIVCLKKITKKSYFSVRINENGEE